MNHSYICSVAADSVPLKQKNPLAEETKEYNIAECCDALIAYQKDLSNTELHPEIDQIEHWWNRKWQVCLDYYLSTPNRRHESIEPSCNAWPVPSIDIALPAKKPETKLSVFEALLKRKTHRKFQETPLDFDILAAMLKECKGELFYEIWRYYLIVFDVKTVPAGIYRYHPNQNGLSLIKEGLFRGEAVKLLCGMSASMTASFLIVLSVDIQEAMQRFPYSRALREIYIDAGRLAQKLLLKGMKYYVGGLPSPAMRDTPMCNFLNLDPDQCIPLYTLTMGLVPKRDP